jgi:hypothetical protein
VDYSCHQRRSHYRRATIWCAFRLFPQLYLPLSSAFNGKRLIQCLIPVPRNMKHLRNEREESQIKVSASFYLSPRWLLVFCHMWNLSSRWGTTMSTEKKLIERRSKLWHSEPSFLIVIYSSSLCLVPRSIFRVFDADDCYFRKPCRVNKFSGKIQAERWEACADVANISVYDVAQNTYCTVEHRRRCVAKSKSRSKCQNRNPERGFKTSYCTKM